jgi:hypothetical protein
MLIFDENHGGPSWRLHIALEKSGTLQMGLAGVISGRWSEPGSLGTITRPSAARIPASPTVQVDAWHPVAPPGRDRKGTNFA